MRYGCFSNTLVCLWEAPYRENHEEKTTRGRKRRTPRHLRQHQSAWCQQL